MGEAPRLQQAHRLMGVTALTWPVPSASIAFSSQAEVAAVSHVAGAKQQGKPPACPHRALGTGFAMGSCSRPAPAGCGGTAGDFSAGDLPAGCGGVRPEGVIFCALVCPKEAEALEMEAKLFEDLEFQQLERESHLEEEREARGQQLLQSRAECHRSIARRKVGADGGQRVRHGQAAPHGPG